MADDNNQRLYRTNEARGTPAAGSANDPLAELARLIGQSDPFAEFGRDSTRHAAPAPEAAPNWSAPGAAVYNSAPATDTRAPAANRYSAAGSKPEMPQASPYDLTNYDSMPFAKAGDLYRQNPETADYAGAPAHGEAYANDGFFQDGQYAAEEDVYDDVTPPRRRMGIMAIAAVFALAVIGTAGAFGYRALFGSSGSRVPPPVINADTSPIKVVPSAPGKDPQSSKMITDRVGDRGQDEKIVSREEQPVAVPPLAPNSNAQASAPLAPANGSGVVTAEPKKVHTIVIRPDQVGLADPGAPAPVQAAPAPAPMPAPAPRAEMPPAMAPAAKPAPPPPQRVANVPPVVAETNPEVAPAAKPAPPAPVRHAPSNAPLSLNPGNAAAAPPRPSAPVRTAAVASSAPTSSTGSYAVQVSSQRSEAEAQAAFRSMQAKYPNQLGGRTPMIRQVDLGAKGVYFRAMIGPFATGNEASELCSSLKSAGGQCIVQKI